MGSADGVQTYRRLLQYIKPYRTQFIIAIAGMIGFALTDTAFAALMKPMLDGSFVEQNKQAILFVPLSILGIFVVRGFAGFASTYYMAWIGWSVIKQLRADVFRKYLNLPTTFYDHASSGELISRITFNSQQVANAASTSLTVLVRDSLTSIGLLAWMFYLSWQLTLCFLVIGPIIGLIVARVSKKFRAISRSIQGSMGQVSHVIQEAIDGSRVIKIFGGHDLEEERFEVVNERNRVFNMRETMVKALNVPIIQGLVAAALAIIVFIASSGIFAERISVGSFMSFITAMLLLFAPMRRLTSLNNQIQQGIAAGESLFGTLDLESERDSGSIELTGDIQSIEYRSVSLRYSPDKPVALEAIDLVIHAGETVAFVGESGSGKTSLVNLLPRMYDIDGGEICVNGKSTDTYTLASLRERIAYVSQDVMLFNDTIANNIAYGCEGEVADHELEAACRAANAHEFITELEGKYQTLVGENGVMLSGGQRQRVAIARALLKNAPILILDEATSALDTESERKVQDGLDKLMQGRTTLVVAHRLSTIEQADRIVVMDAGRIIEVGTHRELLSTDSHYKRLHHLQFS
ncbi:MAG: lipid A export permease/ATP-binding protein MsbA [Gammaproteobacteria bacterium]|nr:lipid A export permease/ATP-binding protein MsbA [Gammaproteobacteria bacterium]